MVKRSGESAIVREIKNNGRQYQLPLAPVKRLMRNGALESKLSNFTSEQYPPQISEAAALLFREAIEDYAIKLAKEIGDNTYRTGNKTLKAADFHARGVD